MDIVLATCRGKPELTPGDELLATELRRRGATVTAIPWDAIDTGIAGTVCLRSTWDYHRRWPDFRSWIESFAGRSILWNPPETVLWNADKTYLRSLAEGGVALPRTRWVEAGERPDCAAILRHWNTEYAVLKPRVSATAYGTHLISAHSPIEESAWPPLETAGSLLQAFVPEVRISGETSLVFIDGSFSHGIRKRPTAGDYRVQADFGGSWEPIIAPTALRRFADFVLGVLAHAWIYARVDVVDTADGPVLMELELIEPDLFLTAAPQAAASLAEALMTRASRAAAA
ncbi:MAG TPA: hypothetical protein VJ808_09750 [Gemmatimonadales bacterium]|nr:hypothetical protein [Gemmatimonadales bacterium]